MGAGCTVRASVPRDTCHCSGGPLPSRVWPPQRQRKEAGDGTRHVHPPAQHTCGGHPGWGVKGSAGRTVAGPGTQSPFLALAQVRDGGQRGTPKATVTQKHTDTLKQPRLIKPRAGTGQLRDDGVASRCRRSSSGRRPASLLRSRAQAPCRGHTSGRGSGKAVPADGRAVGGEHSVLCEYPHASIHCHVTPNARPPESARDRSRLSCFV